MFDLDKIEGDIKIRYSEKGEEFLGLDENKYILDEDMIVICDKKNYKFGWYNGWVKHCM